MVAELDAAVTARELGISVQPEKAYIGRIEKGTWGPGTDDERPGG